MRDPRNAASYNFASALEDPLGHFAYDSFPWIILGASPDDPATSRERVEAYLVDLHAALKVISKPMSPPDIKYLEGFAHNVTATYFSMAAKNGGVDLADLAAMDLDDHAETGAWFQKFATGWREVLNPPAVRGSSASLQPTK